MIGWPACRCRRHPRKAQAGQVQFVDEDLDHPNRILLVDVILQAMRQQRRLHPVFALNEPMHRQPPKALKLRDSKADSLSSPLTKSVSAVGSTTCSMPVLIRHT